MKQFIDVENAKITIHVKANIKIPKELRDKHGKSTIFEFEGKKYYLTSWKTKINHFGSEVMEVEIWRIEE